MSGNGSSPLNCRLPGTESQDHYANILLYRFFQELNSQLFRTVLDAASSEDHVLTQEMIESVGMDPHKDRLFLTELARVYNLNMTVQRSTGLDLLTCCM